jgi:hypothetical protein
MFHQLGNVQETNMLGCWDHWIGHTEVWNLDRPVSQLVKYKVPCRWFCGHPGFVSVLHGFYCCLPQSSEVWFMWWNESSVTSFCGQVLYSCHLWWRVKHVVYFMKLIWCSLEVCAIIRIDCFWFSSTCYETSSGSKECFGSDTCDNVNVDSLCHKTNITI